MAEFKKIVITKKGQKLITKIITGPGQGNIAFTKVDASDTEYTDSQLEELTTLSGVKQTTLVSKVTRTNGVAVQVEAVMTNTELQTGYYMQTLGLYAMDPDDGEILFGVANATVPGWMPPYNGITVSGAFFKLITTVGNAENISLEVDPGAVATIGDIQDLQKQIADLEAFIGYSDEDIFGVEVDFANKKFTRLSGAVNRTPGEAFDSINAFGGRRRCNVKDDGTVTAYYGDSGYTTTGKMVDGTSVQVMVEQPKFYYKVVPMTLEKGVKGMKIRKVRYYVSDTLKPGFKVHPAFIENGNVNPYIYLAAFEGSVFDVSASTYIVDNAQVTDFAADKLSSIAGVKPVGGDALQLTRANTRLLARKRGAGWEQAYAATVAASQLLMLIEYATFNMQTAVGMGNTEQASSAANIQYTGATVSLGNASGSVTNANGVQIVSYRGEENFWGNIWTWVDGMNEQNPDNFASGPVGTLYVADYGFVDDSKASPYKNTGIHPCHGNGYISAFGYSEEFDWLFTPVEYNGDNALPVGDRTWNSNSGWRVPATGGACYNGADAGAYSWWWQSDAHAYQTWYIGGRLTYIPSKNV